MPADPLGGSAIHRSRQFHRRVCHPLCPPIPSAGLPSTAPADSVGGSVIYYARRFHRRVCHPLCPPIPSAGLPSTVSADSVGGSVIHRARRFRRRGFSKATPAGFRLRGRFFIHHSPITVPTNAECRHSYLSELYILASAEYETVVSPVAPTSEVYATPDCDVLRTIGTT